MVPETSNARNGSFLDRRRRNTPFCGRRARWLVDNWNAPLVVTTSVQLLESLFSDRPAACRKLHRLAGAVLLFDEVTSKPSPA